MVESKMKIFFLTPNLEDNSLGRTYVLWLLAQELGLESVVVSTRGDKIWSPLSTDVFADSCHKLEDSNLLLATASNYDIIITIQPLKESLMLGIDIAKKLNKPMIVDIDDPNIVSILAPHRLFRASAKWILKTAVMLDAFRRSRVARKFPTIVSNPVLQKHHGGTIIPHARLPIDLGSPHTSTNPHVVFVGTNRPHKGIGLLRQAVEEIQSEAGFRLTVTDAKPLDAKPWETWVGQVPFASAMALVQSADIIALPSLEVSYGQLPAKLIDAMLAGRAVIASDVDPMPWALNGAGLTATPGDVASLKDGLMRLQDPTLRERLGQNARVHALENFTVSPNAAIFVKVIQETIDSYER